MFEKADGEGVFSEVVGLRMARAEFEPSDEGPGEVPRECPWESLAAAIATAS